MISTDSYIQTRMMLGSSLADENVACLADFTAENLNA
jgi:hypothetical protein